MKASALAPVTADPASARHGERLNGPLPWREAVLLALWLLATIAWRPLFLPDEGRYAGVAYEMLRAEGPWSKLVPLLNGLPYFHKPPLLYWLDIAAMSVFGINEFAVRCGPALLGWVLGMAAFLHARRWHGVAVARLCLIVLGSCPLFFVGAQYVNHDIGVAASITAAVLAIVRAVDDPAKTSRRWLLAGWALCGVGVLAKGLIGVVLPACVIGSWLLAQGRWRQMLGLLHPLGLLVFLAIVTPWMAAMEWRYPGFFDYFIVEQHFRRFTGHSFNNVMPLWFYAVALPLLTLPWSGWLLGLRPARLFAAQLGVDRTRLGLYAWWLLVIVGFFSLPASKLVGYVLPALPPLVLMLSLVLRARRTPWWRAAVPAVGVCLGLVVLLTLKPTGSHAELARTLAARMQPGDRVAFVGDYHFDLPFYARLREPVVVVADWNDPLVVMQDDWHKELADAMRFLRATGARGTPADLLWDWSHVADLPCHRGGVWVVAGSEHRDRLEAAMDGLQIEQVVRGVDLIRVPSRDCRPKP